MIATDRSTKLILDWRAVRAGPSVQGAGIGVNSDAAQVIK